jgi:hypothetical protein
MARLATLRSWREFSVFAKATRERARNGAGIAIAAIIHLPAQVPENFVEFCLPQVDTPLVPLLRRYSPTPALRIGSASLAMIASTDRFTSPARSNSSTNQLLQSISLPLTPARPLSRLALGSHDHRQRHPARIHRGRRPRPGLPVQVRRSLRHLHHPVLRRRRRRLLHGARLVRAVPRAASARVSSPPRRAELSPRPPQLEVFLPFATGFFADDGSYHDSPAAAAWRNLSSPRRFWLGPPRPSPKKLVHSLAPSPSVPRFNPHLPSQHLSPAPLARCSGISVSIRLSSWLWSNIMPTCLSIYMSLLSQL